MLKNIAASSDDWPKPQRHRQPGGFRATVHNGQYAFKLGTCKMIMPSFEAPPVSLFVITLISCHGNTV